MKTWYTIRRRDGKFWAGPGRWSSEHRHAFFFFTWRAAAQEAIDSTPLSDGPSEIIADYGTDTARVVMTVNPSILGEV